MESGSFVPWDALVPSTKSLIEKGAIITIGKNIVKQKFFIWTKYRYLEKRYQCPFDFNLIFFQRKKHASFLLGDWQIFYVKRHSLEHWYLAYLKFNQTVFGNFMI